MKCFENEDWTGDDEIRLEIRADGTLVDTLKNLDFDEGETWTINKSYTYNNTIQFKLFDEDWPDADDFLGENTISANSSMLNVTVSFGEDDADYELIFDLVVQTNDPPVVDDPQIGSLSIRQFFSRMGRGVMAASQHDIHIQKARLYRIGNEVISLRDTFSRHSSQDGNKSNTSSIRNWVQKHCNYRSSDTYNSNKPNAPGHAEIFFTGNNWGTVSNELSQQMAGFQHSSRVTYTDNPFTHETRDWNWDLIPDPTFMYMMGEGMKNKGGYGTNMVPILHCEWESGSFPVQWRPFWGEYVTFWGRHIWDLGHAPLVTEIHPAHTIVREHTTAGNIGRNGAIVPVNQAFIGMGLSGGFVGHSNGRWNAEFGGVPDGVWGDTTDCWATNLENHPLRFKFYPPVERPDSDSTLNFRVNLCRHIAVNNNSQLDDFLEVTQGDDPAFGGEDLAFRDFEQAHGFAPVNTPNAFKPTFTQRLGPDGQPAYFDVEVDLSGMAGIPVGYFAVIECGWSKKGNHNLQKYEVKFEKVKAIETDEWYDDWHMYYGANGHWWAWWTDDFIEEGETYTKNKSVNFWTVDDMPLVIRDTGIEWDGLDYSNEKLDTVGLVLEGSNHFGSLATVANNDSHVSVVSQTSNSRRVKVKGKGGDTSHQWTINITRTQQL